jgi:transposase
MRGMDERTGLLFSYVDLEGWVRGSHPLRAIRLIVNEAVSVLTARFEALYSPFGRPSIPPEQLLRAMLLQAFYSIRSERQLMERLDFDLSFLWFLGLGIDDAVWDHSTFSKNRDRLLDGDVAAGFLCAVLERPKVKRLLSTEHFSIDGTLIEAWASMKSFKAKEPPQDDSKSDLDERPATEGRNAEVDFRGEKRSHIGRLHCGTSRANGQ